MVDTDRRLIDPKNHYPSDCLRRVEQYALDVLQLLPGARVSRTRDVIQLEVGADEGIVVLVTAEALELRLPTVEWTCGAYGPAPASRLWKRVTWSKIERGQADLAQLLAAAQAARTAEFRTCKYCSRQVPPEHMHSRTVCQSCASTHEGIVY